MGFMTELLQKAFERAKTLSAERQDQVGEIVLALVEQEKSSLRLSSSQLDELRRRLAHPEPAVTVEEARDVFSQLA